MSCNPYTVEMWLKGMVDLDVPESAIKAILFNNGVEVGAAVAQLGEREKDLCLADLYMWVSTSSSTSSGETITDNGWSTKKAIKNVTQRGGFRAMAKALYAKWNVDKANFVVGTVKMKDLY